MRMLGRDGNPQAWNLFAILEYLQARAVGCLSISSFFRGRPQRCCLGEFRVDERRQGLKQLGSRAV